MCCASLASEFRNVLLRLRTVCEIRKGCELIANRLPISLRLPTGCQLVANFAKVAKIPAFLLLFNSCSKICTKATKINARKIAEE